MKNVFGFNIKFPKAMEGPDYNNSICNILRFIYSNFNGNKFCSNNKDKLNKKQNDEITYCLKGLDLGRIIRKKPIKEVVDIEKLLAFDNDKENNDNKNF